MASTDKDMLRMALVGYEAERAKIDAAIHNIRGQLGHRGPGRSKSAPDSSVAPAKHTMSAAARRRIAAAQRKRWAALKNAKAAPKKRKLSAAGRKAIAAAARKRWAAIRKAAAKTKPVAKAAA